jgi:hypothetical protein
MVEGAGSVGVMVVVLAANGVERVMSPDGAVAGRRARPPRRQAAHGLRELLRNVIRIGDG